MEAKKLDVEVSLSWCFSPHGWTKCNTDGSLLKNDSRIGCGGVLFLGMRLVLAWLWGILACFEEAWTLGIRML